VGDDVHEVPERGVVTASAEVWNLAVRRAEVIGRLAQLDEVGLRSADAAAAELDLSRRQVYALLRRWRQGDGVVSDMMPGRSSGGRGRDRLPDAVETVIREVLQNRYLTKQRRTVSAVHREVARVCRARGLSVPSRGVLQRRVERLAPVDTVVAREGADAARPLRSAGGTPPPITGLLEQVQMDHTVVDVTVVNEQHRLPIGRPYITVAIDVFSRAIVGMVVTLEPPSALSVGLCLTHMATGKRAWLERLGVDVAWPMSGKPAELYLDNAAEFKSEALRRGCEQHGVKLRWRPPGQPHYGGIVERVIGTMMQMVHELPGTTFSNPQQRGGYDSERRAVLTVRELERWLTLAVAGYHGQIHSTLGQTPAGRWAAAVAAGAAPATVTNETAFLVDFLPIFKRSLHTTGFRIDHVWYHCNALKPWIARRDRLGKFVLRRDPRDISRIWALDPEGQHYLEVPYRTLSHPPVGLFEHRAARAVLREQGRSEVDEDELFRVVEQQRAITEAAARTTRKARRDAARRSATPAARTPDRPGPPPADVPAGPAAQPFAEVEEW